MIRVAGPAIKEGAKFLFKEVVIPTAKGLVQNVATSAAGQIAQGALGRLERAGVIPGVVQGPGQQPAGIRVVQVGHAAPMSVYVPQHRFPTHCSCRPTRFRDPREGKEDYVISLCDACSADQTLGERQFQDALGAFRRNRGERVAERYRADPARLVPQGARRVLGLAPGDEAGAGALGAILAQGLRDPRENLDLLRILQRGLPAPAGAGAAAGAALAGADAAAAAVAGGAAELVIPVEHGRIQPGAAVVRVGPAVPEAGAAGAGGQGGGRRSTRRRAHRRGKSHRSRKH